MIKNLRDFFGHGRARFVIGFLAGSLLCGTAAYSVSVNNTAAGGYLLCYNTKTKALTFPGTLSCPSGTKALEMGATGPAGSQGATGEKGSDGARGTKGDSGATGDAGAKGATGDSGA